MRIHIRLKKRFYFIITLMIILSLYILLNIKIRPTIMALATARLESVAVKAMNDAVRKTIEDLNYSELIKVTIDDSNNVSYIQADTIKMNDVATKTALQAQQNIYDLGQQGVSIPLGTIVGGQIASGRGPKIKVKMEPVGSITSEYETEFENAGINQTRHKIFITLVANLHIIIGATSETVVVKNQILVSETIIIGNVPNSFMNFDNKEDMMNLLPIE